MTKIPGIHHVTAMASSAQANLDFFTRTLGHKLVKQTVNFDAPDVYHLYYGDDIGSPGTIMTYFPFEQAGPGHAGPGAASALAYAIPKADFDKVTDHLAICELIPAGASERFGERFVSLTDPDGGKIELVESQDAADGHGFHSATLWVDDPEPTLQLLTEIMGYQYHGQETQDGFERHRVIAEGNARGRILDVVRKGGVHPAQMGAGSIHHIAFRAQSDAEQKDWMERLASAGHPTTEVRDRNYFNAIYFREPGGILFEIATDPPGFAIDEPVAELGRKLMLPKQFEAHRGKLERILTPLKL